MTVAASLAAGNTQIEFILCVEGIGWPTNEFTLASGFDGDVFVSADFNGTLATDLGCTIHKILNVPSGISDSVDPMHSKYVCGGMQFSIVDDSFLLTALTPFRTGYETTLTSVLPYTTTTIRIDDGTNYAAGAVAWINGSELVLLGTKANVAGTVYDYNSSTRGYLGTRRGPKFNREQTSAGLRWEVGATIFSHDRYLHGRRVLLFLHAPGETVGNCLRVYSGTVQSMHIENTAGLWTIETTSEDVATMASDIITPKGWVIDRDDIRAYAATTTYENWGNNEYEARTTYPITYNRNLAIGLNWSEFNFGDPVPQASIYGMRAAYNYRWEVGGTAGMIAAASTSTTIQALDDEDISTYIQAENGNIISLEKRSTSFAVAGPAAHNYFSVSATITAVEAGSTGVHDLSGQRIKFLLSNLSDDYQRNRFTINRRGYTSIAVSRNAIEVALMFLLSMSDEFVLADAVGGSTTSNVDLGGSAIPSNDFYNGYALFAVEDDNKYQARVILDCTAAGVVVVEKPFGNTPTAGGQYQIRNSIYDVLPFGWGMGIHHKYVDIASFERVMARLGTGADLSKFMIGAGDKIEMWKLITESMLAPFNVMLYMEQSTGQITAKYIGEAFGDVFFEEEAYQDLDTSNIIEVGNTNYQLTKPVRSINCKVRGAVNVPVANFPITGGSFPTDVGRQTIGAPLVGTSTAVLQYRSDEISSAYGDRLSSSVNFDLQFHSILDGGALEPFMVGKLKRYAIAPPIIDLVVDISLLAAVRAGMYVNLTLATWPVSLYESTRGISQSGLILESNVSFETGTIALSVQVLPSYSFGKIAPAAVVTSKGNDAGGDYVVVTDDSFSQWASDSADDVIKQKDWWFFQVGQQLTLRDQYGVDQEDLGEIIGFGTTVVSDPTAATSSRIYFTAGIARVIATGDYVTLYQNWTATEHDNYSAYGSTTAVVDGANELAKRYT